MKRFCMLMLLAATVLAGCQQTVAADLSPAAIAEQLITSMAEDEPFTAADADFIEANFPTAVDEGAVYFGNDDDICEFGIFRVENTAEAQNTIDAINAYIKDEQEALRSLASLYPSEELSERLACYENAVAEEKNGYVYYLIMDHEETAQAKAALANILS